MKSRRPVNSNVRRGLIMVPPYKLPLILSLVLFAGASGSAILGQRVTMTRVTGVVKDNSGGVLPHVTITFRTRKLQKNVMSRSDGSFAVDLPEDTYRVGANIGGCHRFKRNQFDTRTGETVNLDITLKCPATPIRSHLTTFSTGAPNKSLDASGTTGLVIDNSSVTGLLPAASTQPLGRIEWSC
jgi:hypothetical protein